MLKSVFLLEWIIQDNSGFIQCSTVCPQNGESWHVVWKGHLKPVGGWQLLIFITCLRNFTWRYSLKLVSWQIKLIKFLFLSVRNFFFHFSSFLEFILCVTFLLNNLEVRGNYITIVIIIWSYTIILLRLMMPAIKRHLVIWKLSVGTNRSLMCLHMDYFDGIVGNW